MTGSRTQVTVKMSPIKYFVNIESIEVIHVSVTSDHPSFAVRKR